MNLPISNQPLASAIANDNGFDLYIHYTEPQAAKFMGIHAVTLKKRRLSGEVAYVHLGERTIRYFGYQIAHHLIENIKCQNVKPETEAECSKLVSYGSVIEKTAPSGTRPPMTVKPNAQDVAALALATFQ